MSSLNSVQLIGHLGKDPDARSMPSGASVVTLSIATTESWKDKQSGQKQERTEWHRVVYFGRLGEVCSEYLSKGDMIYVGGSIRTRKYTDKEGVERYSTEIVGQEMKMLNTKRKNGQGQAAQGSRRQAEPTGTSTQPAQRDEFDDDIPF